MDFLVDDVSNWYVRLTRPRFYDVDSDDNRAAFATLHEVLAVTCRLLAPFAPFITDWIHSELTGESVHLAPYTRPDMADRDPSLERAMEHIRVLSTLGRAAREEAGIKVRQPLSKMVCVIPDAVAIEQASARLGGTSDIRSLVPLLEEELNVRNVSFLGSADELVTLEAKPNFRTLGKKFGKDTPKAASAVAALSSDRLLSFERGEPLSITVGDETRALDVDDLTIIRRASGDLIVKEAAGYFAAINPQVTPELRAEGLAREVVSRLQRMRKESGFAVSDRVSLWLAGPAEIEAAVKTHESWIAGEVLARRISVGGDMNEHNSAQAVEIEGQTVRVELQRVV
jgi:isoleucyl-tRNA synthetase